MGLLVMQALAVHRDATVAVQLFSLGWGCLVHRSAVGSLLVLLAAVPPLESDVGHKAHNHSCQDGAIDRDEVVGGTSGHHRLGAAHHRSHHI